MITARPIRTQATGSIATGPGFWFGAILTGGVDVSSVTIRDAGAGGAIVAVLKAGIGATVVFTPGFAMPFSDLHLTVTGTTPDITVLV